MFFFPPLREFFCLIGMEWMFEKWLKGQGTIEAKTGMWANNFVGKQRKCNMRKTKDDDQFTWINIIRFSHRNIFSFRGPFYKISRVSSWPCRFSNNFSPIPLPKLIPAFLILANFSYSLFELWIAVIETNIKSNGKILENSI